MAVRLLAFFCALLALGGLVLAGMELQRVLTEGSEDALDASGTVTAADLQPPLPARAAPGSWPALFGEVKAVEPQPPAPPQPPTPPAPPVSSLGYTLKGTVAQGGSTWAILSHPTGDRILRVGDELTEGMTVVVIDAEGIWIETGRGREVLEFAE